MIVRDFISVIPEWSSCFTYFSLSLNFTIRSSWSEPQSAPSLVFADCIELLHLWSKEYNPSTFGMDHLVMPTCRVVSCVVGRGCLLWPVHGLGKTLLAFAFFEGNGAFACFILYSKAKFACYSWYFFTSYFSFQSPIMKRTSFWGASSKRSCRSS